MADVDVQRIHEVHQDYVPQLPPGFQLLGSTPVCAIQGMLRLSSTSSASTSPATTNGSSPSESIPLSSISIISFQGHPEFHPDMVLKIIDAREAKGIISSELAEESRAYARERDDGVWIGRRLLGVLGI